MTEYVTTRDGVQIGYDREGRGPPIVLIAGPSSSARWTRGRDGLWLSSRRGASLRCNTIVRGAVTAGVQCRSP